MYECVCVYVCVCVCDRERRVRLLYLDFSHLILRLGLGWTEAAEEASTENHAVCVAVTARCPAPVSTA